MVDGARGARSAGLPRALLLTGKGGVGKTTVAAAIAVDAARGGGRPLVVELGEHPSLPSLFGAGPIGHEPRAIGHGVAAVALDVDRAVVDYLTSQLRFRALARALASTRALSRFLRAAPAVAEIATFHALERLVANERWDPVIVDLDATGHARMLLELPRVLDGLLGDGPLHRLLGRSSRWLGDEARTCLYLVTTPEELPVEETEELCAWLRGGAAADRVSLGAIVVNQMPALPASLAAAGASAVLDAIESAARAEGDTGALVDVELVRRTERSHARAEALTRRLSGLGLPIVVLPRVGSITLDALGELGALVAEGAR